MERWSYDTECYRLASARDIDAFVALLNDPQVARWLWFTPIAADDARDYFRALLDRQATRLRKGQTPDTAVFAVEDLRGDFLGQGTIVPVEGSAGGFEIGFQLALHAWGRGVGRRLGQFLCAFAIERCNAYRIQATCLHGNTRSAALLRRLGLALEGERPGYRLKGIVRHDELCFGSQVHQMDVAAYDAVATVVGLADESESRASRSSSRSS